jgi:DNA-binding transcriptional MerR regulator
VGQDILKRTWGPAEVATAIGVERATLHSWLARRYVDVPSSGTGRPRTFTFEMVVRLAAIAELVRHNVPVGKAAEYLRMVDKQFCEVVADRGTQDWRLFITDGEGVLPPALILLQEREGVLDIDWSPERGVPVFHSVLKLRNVMNNVAERLVGDGLCG